LPPGTGIRKLEKSTVPTIQLEFGAWLIQSSPSLVMSSPNDVGPSSEPLFSCPSAVAASTPQSGQPQSSTTAMDPPSTVDAAKRNPPPRHETSLRSQPTRSRSRAKRRFSGSTATSSHSPSSDRTQRDKEECEYLPKHIHWEQ
jgi:inositol hexakisphosphate/diphosphoinositol-pentakisphosphate kinase